MASLIYGSLMVDAFSGRLDFTSDTIKVMLTNGYLPDAAHRRRSDIDGEVVGAGYTAGGAKIETALKEVAGGAEIVLLGVVWWDSSVTATAAVYYKSRGGDPADDELICCNDFGEPVRSLNGSMLLEKSRIEIRG